MGCVHMCGPHPVLWGTVSVILLPHCAAAIAFHANDSEIGDGGIRVDRVIVFASLLGIVQERKYNDAGWIEGKKPMYNSVMK